MPEHANDTYGSSVTAADGRGVACAAAAHADDADSRAIQSEKSLDRAEDNAEQTGKQVSLAGGALK